MIQTIKKLAVNWVDGMKISEKHLVDHDDFILDTVRDANSLRCNNFNYGLLPVSLAKHNVDNPIFDVYNTATNQVEIVIKHCSAITEAGYRIEMLDDKPQPLSLKTIDGNEAHYIRILANPFKRQAFGEPDPDETPLREPYTKTQYSIDLLPESTLRVGSEGGNYLIIGRVNITNNVAEVDHKFIPPCTSIHSHPILLSYYRAFAKSMGNLQQYALAIIQKTIKNNQNTALASNVKLLCNTLSSQIANIYFNYRNIVPQQPPVYMIEVFSAMALHLHNSMQGMVKGELEEMLNYSFKWSEIAPHTLLNQLSAVAEINYDHHNCGAHLSDIQKLLLSLETIFSKMSSLEYIGQQKESIIVNDTDITTKAPAQRGWSLLD